MSHYCLGDVAFMVARSVSKNSDVSTSKNPFKIWETDAFQSCAVRFGSGLHIHWVLKFPRNVARTVGAVVALSECTCFSQCSKSREAWWRLTNWCNGWLVGWLTAGDIVCACMCMFVDVVTSMLVLLGLVDFFRNLKCEVWRDFFYPKHTTRNVKPSKNDDSACWVHEAIRILSLSSDRILTFWYSRYDT